MKTLDIFHTWFIIDVIVTKTLKTTLDTFNFCFTKKIYTVLKGVFSLTIYFFTLVDKTQMVQVTHLEFTVDLSK